MLFACLFLILLIKITPRGSRMFDVFSFCSLIGVVEMESAKSRYDITILSSGTFCMPRWKGRKSYL